VSLRRDQLIPVNKAVNEKEQLEKRLEEEEEKMGWATFWAIFLKTHLVTLSHVSQKLSVFKAFLDERNGNKKIPNLF
jgi:hypothetical protein